MVLSILNMFVETICSATSPVASLLKSRDCPSILDRQQEATSHREPQCNSNKADSRAVLQPILDPFVSESACPRLGILILKQQGPRDEVWNMDTSEGWDELVFVLLVVTPLLTSSPHGACGVPCESPSSPHHCCCPIYSVSNIPALTQRFRS